MKLIKSILIFLLILSFSFVNLAKAQNANKALTVGQSTVLFSKALNENRNINIYVPEDYKANDTLKYPVVYILDGGLEEDFFHLSGIVRFNTQPWIARFPKSIVVGIENTNRRRDFTFAVANTDFIEKEGFKKSSFPQHGGSAKYMDFLEQELQPYMAKNYAIGQEKTVIGESLAGLFSTEILLKRPQLFNNYIIISPSLWWGEESLLKNATALLAKNLKNPVKVYVGLPNKAEDLKMHQAGEALYQTIKANKSIHAVFDYMPDELHSTVIHQAVYNAFKLLYPKTAYSK